MASADRDQKGLRARFQALLSRIAHSPRARLTIAVALALITFVCGVLYVRFVFEVHQLRDRRATGPAWSFPSRVYSAAVTLEPGRLLPRAYLAAELDTRGYRRVSSTRVPGEWAERPDGAEIYLRGFHPLTDSPSETPMFAAPPERVRVHVAGSRISTVERARSHAHDAPPRLEPFWIATIADSDRVMSEWVPLGGIARVMQEAVIASEDRRYYHHHGLDLRGNLRALATNLSAGGVRQGASTITQQLAREMFLGRQRSMLRKLREASIALGLELTLSKSQILEMYLNSVYFGPAEGEGMAGVGEASERLFGVPPSELRLDQAALLAGIIPAPSAYSPVAYPSRALHQRNRVLHDMAETGVITAAEARAAAARPLGLEPTQRPPDRFPSFVDAVRGELAAQLPRGAAEGWGLSVITTLDPVWQARAEDKLAEGIDARERWTGHQDAPLEGAFAAVDPQSGAVRALVGGRENRQGDFNRAVRARRQPGSAIKPIVYSAALDPERGAPRFTPGSTVPDLRRSFDTPEGPWTPRNDEGEYHETVTLAKALVHSLNLATANLVQQIGPETVSRYADRFGLGRPTPVASIGLGTHEVTPLALAAAYATFANHGVRHVPTTLAAVIDARGRTLPFEVAKPVRVLSDRTAALMRGLLEDVVIFGIAYPLRADYGFTRPCGGKTGTTNDYHDAWFCGFTPEVAAAVWIGYDVPRSLAAPAAQVAIPVWAGIMNDLMDGFPPTPFPPRDDIDLVWIDPWTGLLARSDCPHPLRTPFVRGTAPITFCTRDHAAEWEQIHARASADSAQVDTTGEVPEQP
jgi:penicillin-binding protein 1B